MDAQRIVDAFDDVFDHALVFHGFTDYMRDYDVFVYVNTDPRTGTSPWHLRYRFTHCVRASVTSTVSPGVWRRSLDERLLDLEKGHELDGYVWGVRYHVLDPGMTLMPGNAETDSWATTTGLPFHEAVIDTNAHRISLVFSDLSVERIEPVFSPFTVSAH